MNTAKLPTTDDAKPSHTIEECAEVIRELADITHAVSKLRRFWSLAEDPQTGLVYDNAAAVRDAILRLESELDDLKKTIAIVIPIIAAHHISAEQSFVVDVMPVGTPTHSGYIYTRDVVDKALQNLRRRLSEGVVYGQSPPKQLLHPSDAFTTSPVDSTHVVEDVYVTSENRLCARIRLLPAFADSLGASLHVMKSIARMVVRTCYDCVVTDAEIVTIDGFVMRAYAP